jgi:hypothetical protein
MIGEAAFAANARALIPAHYTSLQSPLRLCYVCAHSCHTWATTVKKDVPPGMILLR